MSAVYDNRERLVEATMRREQLRRRAQKSFSDLSLASSSSFHSRASSHRLSSFNLEAFHNEQIPRAANYLKIFACAGLKSATRNFRYCLLGAEGAAGRFFQGWIDKKTYVKLSEEEHRLKRWKQATLVQKASRRFLYLLDLKMEKEERKQLIAKIRIHAQVIRNAVLFQDARQGVDADGMPF